MRNVQKLVLLKLTTKNWSNYFVSNVNVGANTKLENYCFKNFAFSSLTWHFFTASNAGPLRRHLSVGTNIFSAIYMWATISVTTLFTQRPNPVLVMNILCSREDCFWSVLVYTLVCKEFWMMGVCKTMHLKTWWSIGSNVTGASIVHGTPRGYKIDVFFPPRNRPLWNNRSRTGHKSAIS